MARQRVRRIVVDERIYVWRVRQADESFVSLRLWRDGDRVPIADVRLRFDDPWLRFPEMVYVYSTMPDRFHDLFAPGPVRPHQVAELIRACVSHAGPGRDFELVGGELRPARR
jgi:hypothetical protein